MCREARGETCVMYREMGADEEFSVDGGRRGTQSSRARDNMQGAERVRESQCADISTNCETNSCNVQIGDSLYCSQCKAGFVPINGKCTAKADATNYKQTDGNVLTDHDTMCGKCEGTTFMYKGGCYEATATPGSAMCKTTDAGKCTAAVETKEYFVPPGADASHDSVVSCGDTAGVTFGSGSNTKTYKGVDGCAKCTAPDAITDTTGTKAAACTERTTNL